nr:nucleotide exchange factor GrpE [Jatrophihabitans endophyticus]
MASCPGHRTLWRAEAGTTRGGDGHEETEHMSEPEQERVVIRDNRKIDRDAQDVDPTVAQDADGVITEGGAAEPATESTEVPMVEAHLLDERTADLQRLQAEYANYRKRAERERALAGDAAIGRVLADLLPIVDDLQRAAQHGDLTGPLKAVADKLDAVTAKQGMAAFGEVGDPFDPSIHEAVQHDESEDVQVPTCTIVMRPGYMHHDRLLRAAMVGVSDPVHAADPGEQPQT